MSMYYVQRLCVNIIMFNKNPRHVKIMSIRDQKQNRKFREDENILFLFLGTKIKIWNIRTKNLFNQKIK